MSFILKFSKRKEILLDIIYLKIFGHSKITSIKNGIPYTPPSSVSIRENGDLKS